ncbi:unnamed protein product [Spirodela intermedia]|uniref:Homeobox domain-containing protein n=1 Tax=Spirodela intermedia TaxID=51605 RepID=A0A7I8J372_SPIIN|nr:unnamed protein product [Spirodela intermedia]CAA6664708.1 unnamed protein product [Spirodela intermedia]
MELGLSLGRRRRPSPLLRRGSAGGPAAVSSGWASALGSEERGRRHRRRTRKERRKGDGGALLSIHRCSWISSPFLPSLGAVGSGDGGGGGGGGFILPNSAVSSFQVDLSGAIAGGGGAGSRNDSGEADRACSRASDEEENGPTRKKLRLSKEQSAYLEESFREHNTLNPKQKVALAKQLNLRPRQVEVWFQNRRARTKLKQTEVDCEYLKSCCERLTEENRRLHKELQELRALKTSHPFYMQLPATTLTMCPSCERVPPLRISSSAAAQAPPVSAAACRLPYSLTSAPLCRIWWKCKFGK